MLIIVNPDFNKGLSKFHFIYLCKIVWHVLACMKNCQHDADVMKLNFKKYHGTGNDFILIDNRKAKIKLDKSQIAFICHRQFGIGGDGLILLSDKPGFDFQMTYYNSDGGEGTMCGNGGRCITAFAATLGVIDRKARFSAIDGEHFSEMYSKGNENFLFRLKCRM